MQIEFERDGGYAGLRLSYRADTDELPTKVAEELMKLVENSGFFNLRPSDIMPTSPGPPDAFQYRLSLSGASRQNALAFDDVSAPDALRPLLGYLQKLALAGGTGR
jgi:hypothetical protein